MDENGKTEILFNCDDQMYPDYNLKVVRKDERTGHLTVTFKGTSIHDEDVSLSYGAQYGPDILDLGAWGHIACQVVDAHIAKNAGR